MKTLEWWGSRGYIFEPKTSFILHVHNMPNAAIETINHLRRFKDSEIIILDDGSTIGNAMPILNHLGGVNEFFIHSNDLFDVVMFNRAIGFARGKYVSIIQDDDDYSGTAWVTNAIQFLDNDPLMAMLGGRECVRLHKDGKVDRSRDGIFKYAQIVNAAPLWVNRDLFLSIGGFDLDFAPMLWHEGSFCIKAWRSGFHVGWYSSGVKMCSRNTDERRKEKFAISHEARIKNLELMLRHWGDDLDLVQSMADKENAR